ncbi:MAG: pectate lyase [Candidatus Zipacnadales bacterium]
MRQQVFFLILLALSPIRAFTAEDHQALVKLATTTLERAVTHFHRDVACHGGYLWRYKADMTEREGEGKASETQIWVQPPGTPSVGLALVEAYTLTGHEFCLQAARDAALALVWGQLACGGWDYLIDFDPEASKKWYYRRDLEAGVKISEGQRNQCTFDDNTTQHALRCLMGVDRVANFEWEAVHGAALAGLQCLMEAQFENGAWPQRWPLSDTGYSRYYTFNDNAINDCISVLLEAYTTYNDERYFECAKRGGDFIILSQCPEPQAGWAQQYDHDMKPAPARWFEPAAVNGAVTPRNIRTLIELYRATRDEKYLKPIPPAIKWLQTSRLPNGKWARFYELGTNKPLYVNMDRQVVYVYDETIRPGYSWEDDYGIPAVIAAYEALMRDIAAGTVEWTIPLPPPSLRTRQQLQAEAEALAPRVRKVCEALTANGSWVREDGWIYSRDFNTNIGILARYLNVMKLVQQGE